MTYGFYQGLGKNYIAQLRWVHFKFIYLSSFGWWQIFKNDNCDEHSHRLKIKTQKVVYLRETTKEKNGKESKLRRAKKKGKLKDRKSVRKINNKYKIEGKQRKRSKKSAKNWYKKGNEKKRKQYKGKKKKGSFNDNNI